MLIPARVVWVGFGVGLTAIAAVALWSENLGSLVRALIGAVGLFVFLFVTHTISPRGMGFGDVRFAAVLGLYLGWIDIRLPATSCPSPTRFRVASDAAPPSTRRSVPGSQRGRSSPSSSGRRSPHP